MSEQRSWYLVYTKPRSEIRAKENLVRQGYETYLPLIQNQVRCNNKNIKRTEAFFPRYLFIKLNQESDNWAPIRSTIGVSGIIRFGSLPSVVPQNLIEKLKCNENESGIQKVNQESLSRGDSVSIISGPLEGQQGIFQQPKSSERVSVLLDIVGKNTQVTLSIHELNIAKHF